MKLRTFLEHGSNIGYENMPSYIVLSRSNWLFAIDLGVQLKKDEKNDFAENSLQVLKSSFVLNWWNQLKARIR